MFRTSITLLLLFTTLACARNESGEAATANDQQQTGAVTETAATGTTAAGKTYPMYGVIVSRDPAMNSVTIDNEDVPGVMAPMKMSYELRGARVESLPPDGTRVQVTLHEDNGTWSVSEVRPAQ